MANPTEYIEISDFSPGIFSDYHTSAIRAPNGAATVDGTYRCCSDPSGALIPLPRAQAGRTHTLPAGNSPDSWPANRKIVYQLDATIQAPIPPTNNSWQANSPTLTADNNYIIHVIYGFWRAVFDDAISSGLGYHYYQLGRSYMYWLGVAQTTRDFFFESTNPNSRSAANTFPRDLPGASLQLIRATQSATVDIENIAVNLTGISSGSWNHGGSLAAIDAGEANMTSADTDFAGGYYTTSPSRVANGNVHLQGALFHYPDPATPGFASYWVNGVSTLNYLKPVAPTLLISHQDRTVVVERYSSSFGNNATVGRDVVFYTGVNDPKQLFATSRPFRTEFGSENTSGIGVIASISSDRLLIIKHAGGGYLVTGDLNNPTITRLPFIESTYNVSSYPALTPMGLVYGTRNGVFVWSGGESTEKLSNQIEGHFWDVTKVNGSNSGSTKYGQSSGRFTWWHPWVMVPNNFMFDSRTNAWWRLDQVIASTDTTNNPNRYFDAPFSTYVVNPANGQLHAFPRLLTTFYPTIDYVFTPELLAGTYAWKSQPLVETRSRKRSFQELVLNVSGPVGQSCTVLVTLSGYDETGEAVASVTETFTFTGRSNPAVLKKNLRTNFVAMNVQISIAASNTSSGHAPKIHSIAIGTNERMRNTVQS
jgi:hypothetical protein